MATTSRLGEAISPGRDHGSFNGTKSIQLQFSSPNLEFVIQIENVEALIRNPPLGPALAHSKRHSLSQTRAKI